MHMCLVMMNCRLDGGDQAESKEEAHENGK